MKLPKSSASRQKITPLITQGLSEETKPVGPRRGGSSQPIETSSPTGDSNLPQKVPSMAPLTLALAANAQNLPGEQVNPPFVGLSVPILSDGQIRQIQSFLFVWRICSWIGSFNSIPRDTSTLDLAANSSHSLHPFFFQELQTH